MLTPNKGIGRVSEEWANLIVISGAWGSSFLFVKLVSVSVPPFAFAAERSLIAMAALLVWLALREPLAPLSLRHRQALSWTHIRQMVVLGTTNGWLANVLTVAAVKRADSAVVAMIQATVPIMVMVLAHFLFTEEKFSLRQSVGIMTGLLGTLLIIGPIAVLGGSGSLVGIGAMLLTAFSYACGTIYGRSVASLDPALLACGQQAFGALIAGVISIAVETFSVRSQPGTTWMLMIVIGVVCSALPTALYLRLLARTTSVRAALIAYLQPVWAVLLGWAVLGEDVGVAAILGTGLVFVGVMVGIERRFR